MTPITPGQCFAEYQDTETGMGDAVFPQRDEIHDIASQDIAQGLHLHISSFIINWWSTRYFYLRFCG